MFGGPNMFGGFVLGEAQCEAVALSWLQCCRQMEFDEYTQPTATTQDPERFGPFNGNRPHWMGDFASRVCGGRD